MGVGERAWMMTTSASLPLRHGLNSLTFRYFGPQGRFARSQSSSFSLSVIIVLLAVLLLIFFAM
jgi:hypothetical protein